MKKEQVFEILKAKLDEYKSEISFNQIPRLEQERLLMGQIFAESSYNEMAVSPVGARGLSQFMPITWHTWGRGNPFVAENAIDAQIRYMSHLYDCYSEIPDYVERFKFALAAYNCGRGNVNKLLEQARKFEGQPAMYSQWKKKGEPSGNWQTWDNAKVFLSKITGRHSKETLDYVEKIMNYRY